jgi:hypothetical protein
MLEKLTLHLLLLLWLACGLLRLVRRRHWQRLLLLAERWRGCSVHGFSRASNILLPIPCSAHFCREVNAVRCCMLSYWLLLRASDPLA